VKRRLKKLAAFPAEFGIFWVMGPALRAFHGSGFIPPLWKQEYK
jgi:hypothetical protein